MHLFRTGATALTLAFSLLVLAASVRADEPIRISGTGSGLVLMKALAAAYAKENPKATFEIQKSLGSPGAIKAIGKGALDIAVTDRPVDATEAAEGLAAQKYGRTPLAVITNKKYPHLIDIRTDQLISIFDGSYHTWRYGPPVRLVLRPLDDVDTRITRSLSPEMDKMVTAAHEREGAIIGITDDDAYERVKKTPGAIGLIGFTLPVSDPRGVKITTLNGVAPSLRNLAAGKYPLYKELFIVTRVGSTGPVAEFLQFISSDKGRAVAIRNGLLVTAPKVK